MKSTYILKWIIMIILPIILSLFFFNPFISYQINDKFVKDIATTTKSAPTNVYNFQIGELNTTDVEESLAASYFERLFNLLIKYQKYDLYFADIKIDNKPIEIKQYFIITTKDGTFIIKRFEIKKIISNIDLNKLYQVNLTINSAVSFGSGVAYSNEEAIKYIMANPYLNNSKTIKYLIPPNVTNFTIYVATTGSFKREWYVRKSFGEFIIKLFFFIILWNIIIIQGILFIYDHLFKEIVEKWINLYRIQDSKKVKIGQK